MDFLIDWVFFQSICDINMASIAKSCHCYEVLGDIFSKHASNFLYDILLGGCQSLNRRVGNKANRVNIVDLSSVFENVLDLLQYLLVSANTGRITETWRVIDNNWVRIASLIRIRLDDISSDP